MSGAIVRCRGDWPERHGGTGKNDNACEEYQQHRANTGRGNVGIGRGRRGLCGRRNCRLESAFLRPFGAALKDESPGA
jgi:hypothetical protein